MWIKCAPKGDPWFSCSIGGGAWRSRYIWCLGGGIKQNCVQILARDIVIEKSNSSTTETGKGLNVGSAEHSVDSLFEGAFGV